MALVGVGGRDGFGGWLVFFSSFSRLFLVVVRVVSGWVRGGVGRVGGLSMRMVSSAKLAMVGGRFSNVDAVG